MTYTITSPNQVVQAGADNTIVIPEQSTFAQTGFTVRFSTMTGSGAFSIINAVGGGIKTWESSGNSIRFYDTAGRTNGSAEYWGGTPAGLVLFVAAAARTSVESIIDNWILINNASANSGVFMRKNGTDGIDIFAKDESIDLPQSGVSITAGGKYGLSLETTNATRSITATLTDFVDVSSEPSDISSRAIILSDVRLSIGGTLTQTLTQKETLYIKMTGNSVVASGELTVNAGATANLSGHIKTLSTGEKRYLKNLILDFVRVSATSYAGGQGCVQILGTLNLKSAYLRIASPIQVLASGTIDLEGVIVYPYDTQTAHGANNNPELAIFGVNNFVNTEFVGKVSALRTPGAFSGVVIHNQYIIQNRTNGSGDDTEFDILGITVLPGAQLAAYGGIRGKVINASEGSALGIAIATFGETAGGVSVEDIGFPFFQDFDIHIKDLSGGNINDAAVLWPKNIPANTPASLKYFNKSANAVQDWVTGLKTPANISYRSGANGRLGTQRFLSAARTEKGLFSFTSEADDVQTTYIKSYSFDIATKPVQMRAGGVREEEAVLLPDTNITATKTAAAAMTGISLNHSTQTLTVSSSQIPENLYDKAKHDSQLTANLFSPNPSAQAINVSGRTLTTNYQVVVSATMGRGVKFDAISSSAPITPSGALGLLGFFSGAKLNLGGVSAFNAETKLGAPHLDDFNPSLPLRGDFSNGENNEMRLQLTADTTLDLINCTGTVRIKNYTDLAASTPVENSTHTITVEATNALTIADKPSYVNVVVPLIHTSLTIAAAEPTGFYLVWNKDTDTIAAEGKHITGTATVVQVLNTRAASDGDDFITYYKPFNTQTVGAVAGIVFQTTIVQFNNFSTDDVAFNLNSRRENNDLVGLARGATTTATTGWGEETSGAIAVGVLEVSGAASPEGIDSAQTQKILMDAIDKSVSASVDKSFYLRILAKNELTSDIIVASANSGTVLTSSYIVLDTGEKSPEIQQAITGCGFTSGRISGGDIKNLAGTVSGETVILLSDPTGLSGARLEHAIKDALPQNFVTAAQVKEQVAAAIMEAKNSIYKGTITALTTPVSGRKGTNLAGTNLTETSEKFMRLQYIHWDSATSGNIQFQTLGGEDAWDSSWVLRLGSAEFPITAAPSASRIYIVSGDTTALPTTGEVEIEILRPSRYLPFLSQKVNRGAGGAL